MGRAWGIWLQLNVSEPNTEASKENSEMAEVF